MSAAVAPGSRGARVRVPARIVSPDSVESPWSGARSAVLRWAFSSVLQVDSHGGYSRVVPLCTGLLGAELVVESELGRIQVGLDGLHLELIGASDPGEPVSGALPEIFRHALGTRRPAPGWWLYYREHHLRCGDDVVLECVVQPVGSAGPYRSAGGAAGATLRACPERGPIWIRESEGSAAEARVTSRR